MEAFIAITFFLLSADLLFFGYEFERLAESLKRLSCRIENLDKDLKATESAVEDLIRALNANSSEHAKAQKLEVIMPKIVAEMSKEEDHEK